VPLLLGWKVAHTIGQFYALGFLLGIAGASFAVALPLASAWYPPQYQGLAMGIAGAGNSGSLMATLCAPRLAERFGWSATFGLMLLPVAIVLVVFMCLAKDAPRRTAPATRRDYTAVLMQADTFWFALLYSLTFGGFVGFASFLTTFFHEQYTLSRVVAGDLTTVVVLAGSLLRPVGGWLSDRIGGYPLLLVLLLGVSGCLLVAAGLQPLPVEVAVLFVALGLLGMGNGAVFQLVPQRFGNQIGLVTGIVGAAGGLGGFFLPSMLGAVRDATGGYGAGLLMFAAALFAGAVALLLLGAYWVPRWESAAVKRAGVFCYLGYLRDRFGQEAA
jgi:NNP family nitrate/nitrite transporter-like MFS transporter